MSLVAASFLGFCAGCVTSAQTPLTSELPAGAVVQKAREGPKRPPLPGTVVALALIKEREGDKTKDAADQIKLYDEARRYYQEALSIDAKHRDAVQGLARVYTRMNDYEHALKMYRKALEKTPEDHGMWFDLGMCYNRQKDLAQAVTCFQKALSLDRENRQYMTTLGFTLARAGQTEQSLTVLTPAMGAAMAHFNIARMMEHMSQTDACRNHLQLALQHNSDLDQARHMLAEIDRPRGATLSFSE